MKRLRTALFTTLLEPAYRLALSVRLVLLQHDYGLVAVSTVSIASGLFACGDNAPSKEDAVHAVCDYYACHWDGAVYDSVYSDCTESLVVVSNPSEDCLNDIDAWSQLCPVRRGEIPPSCAGILGE